MPATPEYAPDRWYTAAEAADALALSPSAVQRRLRTAADDGEPGIEKRRVEGQKGPATWSIIGATLSAWISTNDAPTDLRHEMLALTHAKAELQQQFDDYRATTELERFQSVLDENTRLHEQIKHQNAEIDKLKVALAVVLGVGPESETASTNV